MIEVGHRLYTNQLIAGSEGNFSIRLDQDRILTTPSAICKGCLKPEDIVEINSLGETIGKNIRKPSSETPMHIAIYQSRKDVKAIVHAHPITATGFALAGKALEQFLLPEIVLIFGTIPLIAYGTPSTCELSEQVADKIKNNDGLLLANHGAVTVGKDIDEAYYRMEILEHYAKTVLVATQLGIPQELSADNVEKLKMLIRNEANQLKQRLNCENK